MKGYLVKPAGEGPYPAVLVVHENRGLNPYIEDVARRAAVEGFLALAPDGLSPIGGYPGNDEDGKVMQRSLDKEKLFTDLVNSARYLKGHELSSGKLGATGFCYGGGVVNNLAVAMGADLNAGVPFYGSAPATEDVPKIQAPLLIHYAADDPRINASQEAYRSALEKNGKDFVMYTYESTGKYSLGENHGIFQKTSHLISQDRSDRSLIVKHRGRTSHSQVLLRKI
jgi:carboxymethylenebutenolidase